MEWPRRASRLAVRTRRRLRDSSQRRRIRASTRRASRATPSHARCSLARSRRRPSGSQRWMRRGSTRHASWNLERRRRRGRGWPRPPKGRAGESTGESTWHPSMQEEEHGQTDGRCVRGGLYLLDVLLRAHTCDGHLLSCRRACMCVCMVRGCIPDRTPLLSTRAAACDLYMPMCAECVCSA